jgi:hypothetical protein
MLIYHTVKEYEFVFLQVVRSVIEINSCAKVKNVNIFIKQCQDEQCFPYIFVDTDKFGIAFTNTLPTSAGAGHQ